MRTHNYLARINDEIWEDLKRVKILDNSSINSMIQKGCRIFIKYKLQKISQMKKKRNSIEDMLGL